jgi:hypothetical protein
MSGGKISGNIAAMGNPGMGTSGGGVYGTLTISGGEISGNITNGDGGGVSGTLFMSGGEIWGNTADADGNGNGNGGGVSGTFIGGNGQIVMSGGEIWGNTASLGGGVYATSFQKTDGTIYGYDGTDNLYNNTVKNGSTIIPDKGHAVYKNATNYRDSIVGPGDILNW